MNDYNRFDFFSSKDKITEERHFFLRVNNEMIEVSKDVYYVCYNSYRKQLRDNFKDQTFGLMSLDMPLQDGKTLHDHIGSEKSKAVDEEEKRQLENILKAIHELNIQDRELITELLIHEKKERDLAQRYEVTQQMINKKKKRIIKKIKEKLEKGC